MSSSSKEGFYLNAHEANDALTGFEQNIRFFGELKPVADEAQQLLCAYRSEVAAQKPERLLLPLTYGDIVITALQSHFCAQLPPFSGPDIPRGFRVKESNLLRIIRRINKAKASQSES